MNITENEKLILQNIAENLYTPLNGAKPTCAEETTCWSDVIGSDGPNEISDRSIPGIVSSLSKKGLIDSNNESVMLTEKGYQIYTKIFN